jgi:predicted metal-dependent HD superfamily phosphohydrolase
MNARDLLSHMWRDLARRHGCGTPSAQMVLDELLGAYSQPGRQYHTIEHIASLFRQLEDYGHAVVDRDAVALAILFHDVVYDPLRHDNEEKSAALAGERLAFLGFPGGVIAKVEQYIYGTKHALVS